MPEASNSQLMHSPSLPLCLFSPSHALPLCLFPKLSLFFHELQLSLHPPNPLPLPQVLTTLLHHALLFPPALSHVHMHKRTRTHTRTHSNAQRHTHIYHNSVQPPPHSSKAVQVPLACPDPHLDIALSMLTAKS